MQCCIKLLSLSFMRLSIVKPMHLLARNNEVQFAGAMDEQGVRFTLTVPMGSQHALSRQVSGSRAPPAEFNIIPCPACCALMNYMIVFMIVTPPSFRTWSLWNHILEIIKDMTANLKYGQKLEKRLNSGRIVCLPASKKESISAIASFNYTKIVRNCRLQCHAAGLSAAGSCSLA